MQCLTVFWSRFNCNWRSASSGIVSNSGCKKDEYSIVLIVILSAFSPFKLQKYTIFFYFTTNWRKTSFFIWIVYFMSWGRQIIGTEFLIRFLACYYVECSKTILLEITCNPIQRASSSSWNDFFRIEVRVENQPFSKKILKMADFSNRISDKFVSLQQK